MEKDQEIAELKAQVYHLESALERIYRCSRQHSGQDFNNRFSNMLKLCFPHLAKRLEIR
ncbi:MAG: hypothetical protein WA154_12115 [Moraxellaceae bacterium]